MYWMAKVHKNLCKTKFIISSKLGSTWQFSKSISSVFKLIYNQIESMKARFLINHNNFWVLRNCGPVNNTLKRNKGKILHIYLPLTSAYSIQNYYALSFSVCFSNK